MSCSSNNLQRGGGGGCCWDSETLTPYQTKLNCILQPYARLQTLPFSRTMSQGLKLTFLCGFQVETKHFFGLQVKKSGRQKGSV